MCLPLIFLVLQVVTLECTTADPFNDYIIAYIPIEELAYLSSMNIDTIPVPYYSNFLYADPRSIEGMLHKPFWSSHHPTTTGPVSFGGQVKGKGAVSIVGSFGNQGHGTCTSYSAPLTPIAVTQLASPTLPAVTTLPVVSLPSTYTLPYYFVNEPSTVSVPATPMPVTMGIITVTSLPSTGNTAMVNEMDVTGNAALDAGVAEASPVTFSGMVPASGRVKICAHFC